MVISSSYTSLAGTVITLGDNDIPFTRLNWTREIRGSVINKPANHGTYDTYTLMGHMNIEAEGDLFGMDSADYMQTRNALLTALLPPLVPVRGKLGTLVIEFSGIAEHLRSDVTLSTDAELPLEAMSPSRSKYMIQWRSNSPYWFGVVSGNRYLL